MTSLLDMPILLLNPTPPILAHAVVTDVGDSVLAEKADIESRGIELG